MNPYIFNFLNGAILCVLGLWSFSLGYSNSLYAVVIGVVLILLTYFVRDSHKLFGSIAMILTFAGCLFFGFLFYSSIVDIAFSQVPISIMFISGIVTSGAFLRCALKQDKTESCAKSEGDKSCCDKGSTKNQGAEIPGCC